MSTNLLRLFTGYIYNSTFPVASFIEKVNTGKTRKWSHKLSHTRGYVMLFYFNSRKLKYWWNVRKKKINRFSFLVRKLSYLGLPDNSHRISKGAMVSDPNCFRSKLIKPKLPPVFPFPGISRRLIQCWTFLSPLPPFHLTQKGQRWRTSF